MANFLRHKIEHWRNQPEQQRMRTATLLTWSGGAIIIALWLTVLLPLQLFISNDRPEEPAVQGVSTEATPTATPTPTSIFE